MTTLAKACAGLAVALALVWLLCGPGTTRREARPAAGPGTEVGITEPPREAEQFADTPARRIPVIAGEEPGPPTTVAVRVRDGETGATIAGATVRFVNADFTFAGLTAEQQDRYSRSTERFLRDHGECLMTDENGIARIPIAAAGRAVVARKGELYGANRTRIDGTLLEIAVTRHHTLVIETADARGDPVPHVKVLGRRGLVPMPPSTIGTTDDAGTLTHFLRPGPDEARQLWLHVELIDGLHGREAIDLDAPPTFVRLTLPRTGTVRARITDAAGSAPDREILGSLHAELAIAGSRPPTRLYVRPDTEGCACFANVVLDQTLQLRFPGVIIEPMTFAGPTADQREISVVQSIAGVHPFVVGTLVGPGDLPIAGERFAILCRRASDVRASVGATTDARGRFLAYLSDGCIDGRDVVFTLGLGTTGLGFAREANVPVAGPLRGRVDLGVIAMPPAK